MEICVVGVGGAWQPELGNASVLIRNQSQLLVDCGFGVPARLFGLQDFDKIDGVYLTHFHGDHTFGIPALIGRLWDQGRKRPLTFIGQPGTKKLVEQMMNLAYSSLLKHIPYPIEYIESTTNVEFNELELRFAKSDHSQPNYAVSVSADSKSVGISGDGAATSQTLDLFSSCSLVVHECYRYQEIIPGHGTASALVEGFKQHSKLQTLCLTHLHSQARSSEKEAILGLGQSVPFELCIPEPGDVFEI